MIIMLGLMLTLVSCEKPEADQITITSLEVDKTNYNPLEVDQVISFLEGMNIGESSRSYLKEGSRSSDNEMFSFVLPNYNFAGASNGESFGITGIGDLTLNPKSVCGGGEWIHNDDNGDPIASGSWEVEQLMSYLDYGPSPLFPPFVQYIHAGKSIMRIHLGEPANVDAILTIYCILPAVQTPPSWPEGIKISIQNGGPNFNQIFQGGTFFAAPNEPDCEPECFSPFPACLE